MALAPSAAREAAEAFAAAALQRPYCVMEMTRSHVVQGFWLHLPAPFIKTHYCAWLDGDRDIHLEEQAELFLVKTKAKGTSVGLSGGWAGFAKKRASLGGPYCSGGRESCSAGRPPTVRTTHAHCACTKPLAAAPTLLVRRSWCSRTPWYLRPRQKACSKSTSSGGATHAVTCLRDGAAQVAGRPVEVGVYRCTVLSRAITTAEQHASPCHRAISQTRRMQEH